MKVGVIFSRNFKQNLICNNSSRESSWSVTFHPHNLRKESHCRYLTQNLRCRLSTQLSPTNSTKSYTHNPKENLFCTSPPNNKGQSKNAIQEAASPNQSSFAPVCALAPFNHVYSSTYTIRQEQYWQSKTLPHLSILSPPQIKKYIYNYKKK